VRLLIPVLALWCLACRIETSVPGGSAGGTDPGLRGEVWIYTSMYRHVLDALDAPLKEALPGLTVRWFQAGSEKVTARLEAELAAGGSPCDVLVTSDPFLYERFKREGRLLRHVAPDALRTPAGLFDVDGHYAAVRLSTMVIVHRAGIPAPEGFEALTRREWRGAVALGDPLTSGTAFTWAVVLDGLLGADYFQRLRANGARVAGGNAAVLQKLEGGEATAGVLLLENALAAKAKGSPIEIAWPSEGAVLVPGYAAILSTARNPSAARAVVDALRSPAVQGLIASAGDMHSVDPRVPGPRGLGSVTELLARSQPWSDEVLARGLSEGARVKTDFSRVFSK
jgi:iron(III) transport system substrate-binding protein